MRGIRAPKGSCPSERVIMQQTGHKNTAVLRRYIREGSLEEYAVAHLMLNTMYDSISATIPDVPLVINGTSSLYGRRYAWR